MRRRRVKITGIGPVTPAGIGRQAFWDGIQEPVSRVSLLKGFPEEGGTFVGAEVKGFRLQNYLPGIQTKRMPRHTQLAVAAADRAVRDAGLSFAGLRPRNGVVMVGASLMDFGSINKGVELVLRKGPINAIPSSVFSASISAISIAICELIGGTTRSMALQTTCCSGLDAVGHAADMVARGEADYALCGGTEGPLYFHPMLELRLAGLSPGNPEFPERQCRPFDLWRTTGLIGEGACVLVLEPEESPRPGYAFIDGYAYMNDPKDGLCVGMAEAMELALANGSHRPSEVDCISAWGPGHKLTDVGEVRALRAVFGDSLDNIPTASIKGAIGNPLGAAGAIQVACAALGLRHSVIPPTVNWQYPDPDCRLNLSAKARHLEHGVALVNSHGLAGTNACLVLTN